MSISGVFKVLKGLRPVDYFLIVMALVFLALAWEIRSLKSDLRSSNATVIKQAGEKAQLEEIILQKTMQETYLLQTLVQERKTANAERSARESAEQSLQKSQQTLRSKEEYIRDLLKKDSIEIRDCYNTPAPDYIIDRVFGMGSDDESTTGDQDDLRREN